MTSCTTHMRYAATLIRAVVTLLLVSGLMPGSGLPLEVPLRAGLVTGSLFGNYLLNWVELGGLEPLASCMPWDVQQFIDPATCQPETNHDVHFPVGPQSDGQIPVEAIYSPRKKCTRPTTKPPRI